MIVFHVWPRYRCHVLTFKSNVGGDVAIQRMKTMSLSFDEVIVRLLKPMSCQCGCLASESDVAGLFDVQKR